MTARLAITGRLTPLPPTRDAIPPLPHPGPPSLYWHGQRIELEEDDERGGRLWVFVDGPPRCARDDVADTWQLRLDWP